MRHLLYSLAMVSYLIFFMFGCSTVQKSYSALQACEADPSCFAEMEKGKDLATSISLSALSKMPQPMPSVGPMVSSYVGMLTSLLLGVYLGRKKVQK